MLTIKWIYKKKNFKFLLSLQYWENHSIISLHKFNILINQNNLNKFPKFISFILSSSKYTVYIYTKKKKINQFRSIHSIKIDFQKIKMDMTEIYVVSRAFHRPKCRTKGSGWFIPILPFHNHEFHPLIFVAVSDPTSGSKFFRWTIATMILLAYSRGILACQEVSEALNIGVM